MAKETNKKSNQVGEGRMKMNSAALVNTGAELGTELIGCMAGWGCSTEALMIETYAMGMAWAALKAMCKYKGYEPKDFFQLVADSYEDEMNEFIEEIEGEK